MHGRVFQIRLVAAAVCVSAVVLALGLLFRVPAAGFQVATASLSGTVVDESDAVVPNVKITVMNAGTALERRAVTDSDGYFVLHLLVPGTYVITAEMPGFRTVTVNDWLVEAGHNRPIEIVLYPGEVAETLDVVADSNATGTGNRIDITSASVRYSISNKQVVGLPVWTTSLGRNGLAVLPFLVPGVVPTATAGSADSSVNRLGGQMSINGSRPSSISFNLEGGDNNDNELNQAASPLPNPDVLQEFSIATNNYRADQGRSAGGIIDAVAKSGTNKLSGNLRYFAINEALNARGFFDSRVPQDRLNTFGGQIGGPIVLPKIFDGKRRSFFFLDYEGTRYSREQSVTFNVLTRRERLGDFNDPRSVKPRDPETKKPFPGNVIPSERFNPISIAYIEQFIPLPNQGDNQFRQLIPSTSRADQFTARLDHAFSSSDTMSTSVFYTRSTSENALATLPAGSTRLVGIKNINLVLRETHVFSPRAVNQFTHTLTKADNDRSSILPGANGRSPDEFGIPGVHPQSDRFLAPPTVRIAINQIIVNDGSNNASTKTTWQLKDDFSLLTGVHELRFGAEVIGFRQEAGTASDNGRFTFSNLMTFNFVADFLLGFPQSYSQASGNEVRPSQHAYYAYAMDDWRLRPNLTVNLGLRYELAPPPTDERDQVTVFRPRATSTRFPHAPEGLLFPGDPDPILGEVPRAAYPRDANNFAPRFGVAFSPRPSSGLLHAIFGNGKTAIRTGLGVFYDQTFGLSFTQFSSVQPFSVTDTLDGAEIRSSAGTFANPYGLQTNPWPLDREERVFIGAPEVHTFDPSFKTAYVYHYNLVIQRELPFATLLEVGYMGSASFKLNRRRELNFSPVTEGANRSDIRSRRLYRHLGSVQSQESSGSARYDSIQVRVARRPARGLLIDGSYVFSHALDNGSDPFFIIGPDPFRWARSAFDRTHNVVVGYSYDLPSSGLKGIAGRLADGWQLGGITELRSGKPMDIGQFFDPTLTGRVSPFLGIPDFVGPYRRLDPRERQTIRIGNSLVTGNFFFDPNAFREVVVRDSSEARVGNLGRNVFDGPGINLWSLSLIKGIQISESQSVKLRADVRNIFNRTHFNTPGLTVNGSGFGQVISSAPGRNIQLSLRYTF